MNVLLIEDDDFKAQQVSLFLRKNIPDVSLQEAKSVHAGSRALRQQSYDLLLLDMSLPTYTIVAGEAGWRPQGFGGRDVLRNLERQGLTLPVIVITQFERFESGDEEIDISTLRAQLEREHSSNFLGLIYFDATTDSWQAELSEILASLRHSYPGQTEEHRHA